MQRSLLLVLALAFAGCAGEVDAGDGPHGDAGTGSDGGVYCVVAFDPFDPVASPILPIRAYVSNHNATGVLSYQWSVTFNGSSVPFTQEASDGSQIGFIAPEPGVYSVAVSISGSSVCPLGARGDLNVEAPGANADVFRQRVVPPPSLAPPQEKYIQVKGGADANRDFTLDRGIETTGLVRDSTTSAGVAAYLKFIPSTMPTAFSEVFSSSSGAYTLRLLPVNHDVLVIPSSTSLAPKRVPWTAAPMTTQLAVGPGTPVTGTVRGPNNAGLSGAKVQLYAGGVPSTLGTTDANGNFTVRTDFPSGVAAITVKVTPREDSGLPRLEATSAFSLASPLQIQYSASLATCDLANVQVRRGAAAQPGAKVTVVGTLAGVAGTIGGISATNTVRISATADGNGRLPAMLVPRGALTAVTELATEQQMTDHAASALDTSTCSVAAIDAPAMTEVEGTTKRDETTPLGAVRIEAEPVGALALAGVPPVQVTSELDGAFELPLAPGGRYNVRFFDPQARAAPLVASDVTVLGVPTNAILPKALAISGEVRADNHPNPVIGASVQILCATCAGLDAARPIAETATDTVSRYRIAVPDPGTM